MKRSTWFLCHFYRNIHRTPTLKPQKYLHVLRCSSSGLIYGIYVSETLRKTLFSFMHDLSHSGANASMRLVSDRFVRPRMKAEIQQWVKACVPCQKAKVGRHTRSSFGSFPSPDERFAHVHVDITGPLPLCEGQSHLLTCVDRFSRWCEAFPMPDITTYTTAKTFVAV